MIIPRIKIPDKLIPVFTAKNMMYRGAYGGRGSAKTMSFAKMSAIQGIRCAQAGLSGIIVCGRELQNSLDDSSMAEVKAAIRAEPWMLDFYDVGQRYVTTKDGLIDFSFIGLRHNIDSVKSKSKIRLLWVDEAEAVSADSWEKADDTVREDGAEVWVTWNPERRNSPTDIKFRQSPHPESIIVPLNWRDNLKFPETLNKKRLHCLATNPDQYDHIWEGDYVTVVAGAYYAAALTLARSEHRITHLVRDPLITVRAFCDIGGTGAKADAFAIWIAQFIGKSIHVIDYYEARGQEITAHVYWLRERGYDKAQIILPHDGVNHDRVYDITYESEFRRAGFDVPPPIPNQGPGAANQRIECSRRMFPRIWFNEATTHSGLDALGWYHEKRDEHRNIGLGPDHDWSSHCADAFGLMNLVAEDIFDTVNRPKTETRYTHASSGSWMG